MRKTLSISVELVGKEIEIREKEPKDKQDNQNDFRHFMASLTFLYSSTAI